MGAMASQITSLSIVYSTVYLDVGEKNNNTKAPRHWPLCGEFTGHRWIPHTNGQERGKLFYLKTSSCDSQDKEWYQHYTSIYMIMVLCSDKFILTSIHVTEQTHNYHSSLARFRGISLATVRDVT